MKRRLLLLVGPIAALALVCQSPPVEEEPEQQQEEDDDDESWQPPTPITEDDRNPLILVGIDGVKHSYLERYESSTPNLNHLADQGVVAESLKPVFPSYTFPNLYSIVTGLYPDNHGIISNTVYDPVRDETLRMSDTDAQEDPEWWGGEPIWVTAERHELRTGTFFWVGSQAKINDVRPTHFAPYDSSIPHTQRTEEVIDWLTADEPVDFATLYFASPDFAGHESGTESDDLDSALEGIDNQIGRLVNRLDDEGLWPDVNLLIVSDHGMTNTDEDKVVFLDDKIDLRDVDVIEWTPVSMIAPEEGKADEIYDQLREHDDHYEVYRRDDLPERYRLGTGRRVPEIIVVADKPYTLTSRPFYNQEGIFGGDHGYDPEYRDMHGIFIADGPDLPDGHQPETLEIVDLYPLMSYLLALEPAAHDGSLERIGPAIFGD